MEKVIFVFGSNLGGFHSRGAAYIARMKYGAIYGQGEGLQGDSYAIPTKCARLRPRPLQAVKKSVDEFVKFAQANPSWTFKVTAIGTGLAGFSHEDIAPMFYHAPLNCILPLAWKKIIPDDRRNWWYS